MIASETAPSTIMDPIVDPHSSDESNHTAPPTGAKRKRRDTAGTIEDDKERHQCPHCERSFGRVEHMKRHAASHSTERPFKCQTCDKGFHRLDTMQRHELIHREQESAKPKGARACSECALAKVRCPGGQPCNRCETKALDCRYPDIKHKDGSPDMDGDRYTDVPPVRSQSISGVPYSPAVWTEDPTSPSQWLPPPPPPVDLTARPPEFEHTTPAPRHLSFSSNGHRPTGLTPLTGDPYSNLRQAGFVTATSDNASVNGGGTRNWLDTLLAPQSIDARDASTPDTGSHKTASMSETYLDGDGARLPKIGIHRRFNLRPSLPLPTPGIPVPTGPPTYGFPTRFTQPELDMKTTSERRIIDEVVYNEIRRNFESVCGPNSSYSPVFESPDYPSWDHMQMFIQIYLDEFQTLVPMLHLPTLNLYSAHWLLSLALAAMGCHFADYPEAEYCALGLNEHLRRAINDVLEVSEREIDPVLLAQVKLLNCIGMIYSGDERMERFGWRHHHDLVRFCHTHWVNEDEVGLPADAAMMSEVEVQWRHWKDVESRRRTGYGIWMLDCMWSYGFGEKTLLTLEDAKVPVPSQEVLWEAESALQWQHVKSYSVPMPSLVAATHSVYIEKRVEPTMGEFSRILLIHALYSSSWSVQTHLKNPLTHWTPKASKTELSSLSYFREPIWLPSEPSYFRWRNATCDCLDILHWRANSVTGAASGIEHPTLLHLHLARIILLTPFREICDLAFGLTKIHMHATTNIPSDPATLSRNRDVVRRWAEHDQAKARLAMYHAGVLFWHVRLYSAKGFYEPSAVLLAALALWAFGTYTTKHPHPNSSSPMDGATTPYDPPGPIPFVNSADDEASFPTSINIDRPADDEIVQMYIRRGDRMQALIVGVGDIRSSSGPGRVLGEGAKLVSSLANWGHSRRVMRILGTLQRVVRETPGVL
ncbi:hypothetical protein BDZ85DRAFT_72323 [Elsinoe ampelina]|uniref:Fungal-specific transcription factor domain-containing protein n=1 Tax=Elsinoe ampelina TaxID=302913 RepID=A0A6A6GJE8_9PEZI|nr:hypothetical protein BDZ85DRAFT_72323 [Elsinoe ampelina]